MGRIRLFFISKTELFVIIFTILLSICSLVYYYQRGLILAYGDAESHLNIAKRVIHSITPGFGQLGGVWLPLQHIMMLPFVWNDFLWRTGLAGSIVSMICFVFSTFFCYRIVLLATGSTFGGLVGALAFALNPNILYLQVTPLGELALIVMLLGAVYCMAKWAQDSSNILYLIGSAFFITCGSLIRYDAWFLFLFSFPAIALIAFQKKIGYAKIEGYFILFGSLAMTGIIFWLGWNMVIFKTPFYFLKSPYSAKSQQLTWLSRGQLPSYHNIQSSFAFYTLDTLENAGIVFSLLALLSLILSIYIFFTNKQKRSVYTSIFLIFIPYPFYIITLFLGISIILLPQLTPASYVSQLFNVRYGSMMIPAIAIFVGILFGKLRFLGFRFVFVILIGLQFYFFVQDGIPIVLADGLYGLSTRRPSPVNGFVRNHYDFGLIMFDDYSRTANPVSLGIPMQKIIYVGNHPYWDESLIHPTKYIRWFIIRHDENDFVWSKLRNNKEFLKNYKAIFNNEKTYVYKRK